MNKKFILSMVLFLLGIGFMSFDFSIKTEDSATGWSALSFQSSQNPFQFLEALAQEEGLDEDGLDENDETEGNALTIYNQNMALVKQIRNISLKKGINEVSYTDVPKLIQPNTVFFEDLTDSETRILEQSYEYDLVSGTKLFERFLDKDVTITINEGDSVDQVTGTLLSAEWGDVVLKTEDGVKVIQKSQIIDTEFPELPEGFSTKPTLVWAIWANKDGTRNVRTSYLTRGISWSADYVVVVDKDDENLSLKGWTTIVNNSGTSFPETQLKLVAGDVNTVSSYGNQMFKSEAMPRMNMAAMDMDESMGGFGEESFFEYHLYSLERKTHIKNNASKQIELFNAQDVKTDKEFVFDPQKNSQAIQTVLKFQNEEENNLGMPIPKGVIRVYKKDESSALQFIGEDSINHTPHDEEIEILLGNVFDVTVEKKQLKYETTKNWVGFRECSFATHEVELKNHKEESITVQVYENVWGANGEIQKPSVSYFNSNKKEDSEEDPIETLKVEVMAEGNGKFKMPIEVGANQKSVLTYMVQSCR